MEVNISDIRCPNCGAEAKYNIIKRQYLCRYCDGKVTVDEAHIQNKGFRAIQQEKIKDSAFNFHLLKGQCSGCGASVIFEENEALSKCSFCGNAMVRKDYIDLDDVPERIIPFRIIEDEAKDCLRAWCKKNSHKKEAKDLIGKIDLLKGFYLPYELIKGPVSSKVSRMDGEKSYMCQGYVDNVFVNCSKQLNNQLLDACEPFELDELVEFDFSYVAGHRVKIGDIDAKTLQQRVNIEVSNDYEPTVQKTLETKAVNIKTSSDEALRMPVLLPMYYICTDDVKAVVNGQTGKVSVQSKKSSHYYFMPWWIKPFFSTIVVGGISFITFYMEKLGREEIICFTTALTLFWFIISLCVYSDSQKNHFRVEAKKKIYSSILGPLRRIDGKLIQDEKPIQKDVTKPVFIENIEGIVQPVMLRFKSPLRSIKIIMISTIAMFFPVIIALFLNGFNFNDLNLQGSAAWFCISVPIVPVYIIKFAIVELYERPWIYIIRDDNTKKRYRKKSDVSSKEVAKKVVVALFKPPVSLAVWFAIISVCAMSYLTAFGLVRVETPFTIDKKLGAVVLEADSDVFEKEGFKHGDSCNIEFDDGKKYENVPFYSGEYGEKNELVIVDDVKNKKVYIKKCLASNVLSDIESVSCDNVKITVDKEKAYQAREEKNNKNKKDSNKNKKNSNKKKNNQTTKNNKKK